MALDLITDNDAPQNCEAEYLAAVAVLRLQHLIATALYDYCMKADERGDLLPSAWVANRLVVQIPGLLELIQGEGAQ